jgi:beta-fructofuranosidase
MGQPSGALTPTIISDWLRIVEYPENHLNDFCLFRDQSGLWHAIGIMGTGEAQSEVRFFHSTGESLRRHFTNREPLFEGLPTWIGERRSSNLGLRKHAPFVVYHDSEYHMFYRRPNGTNLHVRTRDPLRWPNRVELAFEEQDARDSCLIRVGETFYHYSCQAMQIDGAWRSCVAVRTSRDLRQWSAAEPAHVDTSHITEHSRMESPFVVPRPEGYYLFVRNRMFDYPSLTTIYFSQTPRRFPSGSKAWFAELENVHAPEIVEEGGRYFIARVSGARHANRQAPDQGGGWIEVAELAFRPPSKQNWKRREGALFLS